MVTGGVLQALDILGITPVTPQGVQQLTAGVSAPVPMPRGPDSLLFGLRVFRGHTTQFQPLLSGPVPDSYRVGPGDVMVVVLTGDVELVHQLQVTREGFVVIPQVGQLYVSGLPMAELRRVFAERLARSYSGIRRGTTHFDVTIARLRTVQAFVIGEVVQPGAYQLSSVATVMNALYAAGGPTTQGNFRQVRLQRGGRTVATVDLYDYLLAGSTAGDSMLQDGDVVFVAVQGTRAMITGAVVRPALYEVAAGETLADLVRMAGGFRAEAQLKRLSVFRILPPAGRQPAPAPRVVIDVPLGPTPDQGTTAQRQDGMAALPVTVPPLALENGDSVVVDSVLAPGRSLYVTVGGMVNKPGQYPWQAGMTLKELVTVARGPIVGADLKEAEIARLPTERKPGDLARAFRVALDSSYLFERDSLGRYIGPPGIAFPPSGTAQEVKLEPYDQVTIFAQPGFELQRTVTITGEVQYPGPYALESKDERLSDLVRRAGGLLPTAYAGGMRFIRSQDTTGRVDVDLEAALARPKSSDDLVLQPGDSVDVPEFIPIVKVVGAVNSPTSVRYERGRGLKYYIGNAGGYANRADKGGVSVRYADGSARVRGRFLFLRSSPAPGPGSTISVPVKAPGQGLDLAVLLGSAAQVLSAVTTMILVVHSLSKP